jgi:hypothetical protein
VREGDPWSGAKIAELCFTFGRAISPHPEEGRQVRLEGSGVTSALWTLLRDPASLLLRMRFDTIAEKRPSRRTVFTHISSWGAVTPVGAKMGSRFISYAAADDPQRLLME